MSNPNAPLKLSTAHAIQNGRQIELPVTPRVSYVFLFGSKIAADHFLEQAKKSGGIVRYQIGYIYADIAGSEKHGVTYSVNK